MRRVRWSGKAERSSSSCHNYPLTRTMNNYHNTHNTHNTQPRHVHVMNCCQDKVSVITYSTTSHWRPQPVCLDARLSHKLSTSKSSTHNTTGRRGCHEVPGGAPDHDHILLPLRLLWGSNAGNPGEIRGRGEWNPALINEHLMSVDGKAHEMCVDILKYDQQ